MNKTAVITGASRGIGAAIARALAKDGYDLRLCCQKNSTTLSALAKELSKEYTVDTSCFCGDVADSSFAEELLSGLDKLDLLVNNAGISDFALVQDISNENWDRMLSVNLSSAFYLCRAAIPLMLARHEGRIINISSVWGAEGAAMEAAYAAAKGGLNAFTRSLAKELAPSGIAVNALLCGYIDTDMNAHLSTEEKAAIMESIPAGRAGTPEEVAECVRLLSQAPAYLSGQLIKLDGCWT